MAEMEHYQNFQKDNYIHPKAAWDKLRMAGARRQNVYLYAATGYGKTELLHRYLRRRRHIWLSGEGLTVETLQEIALPAEATMVIDDLARVLDPAVRREIVSMLDQPGLWLVLAGRCPLPSWLTGPYVNGRLSVIPEEDLRLSEKEIAQLYLSWGVQLPRNLLEKRIIPLVEGNPLGARLLAVEMSQGSSYTEELMNDLTRKFYEYLNQAIYSEWPEEIREMMMQLSLLEHFTIQQAEEMTGRSDVNRLLAQAAEMGNLFSFKDGGYTLRPAVINSMKLRMETVCDRVRKNELLRRAGTICEKEGNIPRALKLYQDGQCEKEIHALLIDNARRYPGGGYYYELTPAYLALPEEEVRSSPDLIAARSMLYSLALNATESERWYAVLQEYAADHPDPEEHRLAESWLVYLDISLPHRGSTNLIEVLDEAARKIQTERLVMPEFSVTGGQPSLFVRLFCREGAALLPLLQELGCPEGVDEAYWQEVLGKTRTMAEAYPLYLSTNAPAALPGAVQLSERALQVLRLQDRGLTRSEIARQLQLSERSVKYQCEQAYHKLGTSNKVEALAAARKLNLL